MIDRRSRYVAVGTATLDVEGRDGEARRVPYLLRRFVPTAQADTTLVEHTVTEGERLDNITARYLGDPTQFWRICDASRVLDPNELTDRIGRVVRIAVPGV